MSELDEKAVEAAIEASWIPHVYIGVDDGQEHEITREEIQRRDAEWTAARRACGEDIVIDEVADHRWQIEQAITAYLAAAARPTPDAEAWVPMSDDDVAAMTARIKSGEADEDEQARFAMTNMVFIIQQWASGAVDATNQQAYAAALLDHAKHVHALFCPTPDAEAMVREFVEVLNRHDGNVTTLTVTRIVSKSDEKAERLAAGSKQELIDLYRKAVSR